MTPNNLPKIAAGNAGWPFPPSLGSGATSQFCCRGSCHESAVAHLDVNHTENHRTRLDTNGANFRSATGCAAPVAATWLA
jgi:hypothetical protein